MDVTVANMGMDMMHVDMGLMPDTMYYYRVRAVNAAGYSDWAEAMATTLAPVSTVPSSPSNVMATDTTTNPADLMITVTWTDGENVEAYGSSCSTRTSANGLTSPGVWTAAIRSVWTPAHTSRWSSR